MAARQHRQMHSRSWRSFRDTQLEAQDEDHRHRQIDDDHADGGSRRASRNDDDNGTVGRFPRPFLPRGVRTTRRTRRVVLRRRRLQSWAAAAASAVRTTWAVRGASTQWKPFPMREPFLCETGHGRRGGFDDRPPLHRRGDWVHNQQADSRAPYVPRQSPRGRGDTSANAQDRPERHRLPQRCYGVAAGWRARDETSSPRNQVTPGDERKNGQHMQRKRTHRDTFRSGDGKWGSEYGGKRDRRHYAAAWLCGRYESKDRGSIVAVAADAAKRSAYTSRGGRDDVRGASCYGNETCIRTDHRGTYESNAEGKSSKVTKSATAHPQTKTKQASESKFVNTRCNEELSVRFKVKLRSDADHCAPRERNVEDKRRKDAGKSASKQGGKFAERLASLQRSSGDRRLLSPNRKARVPAGRGNQLRCDAAQKSKVVYPGDQIGIPKCTQNAEASRAMTASVGISTDSRPNEGTKHHQLDKATGTSKYRAAEVVIENMQKPVRLQAPKMTDEHDHWELAVSDVKDTEANDPVPPTCFQGLDTDSPAQPSPQINRNPSETKQYHTVRGATFSSSVVHDENTEGVVDTGLDSVAGSSSRPDISATTAVPLAPFERPAKDVTAAVNQWLRSSFPATDMTSSSRELSRSREADVPAVSSLFKSVVEREAPLPSAVVSLSTEVECEQETESYASTAPGDANEDDNGVFVLPALDAACQARRGAETMSVSSDVPTVTTSPSVEDLRLVSLQLSADRESAVTSAAPLTADILFQLDAYTALHVASVCRDEEAKQQVLQLYIQGRRTGATEACAVEIRKVTCAVVKQKRVVWKDLTAVLRGLARGALGGSEGPSRSEEREYSCASKPL